MDKKMTTWSRIKSRKCGQEVKGPGDSIPTRALSTHCLTTFDHNLEQFLLRNFPPLPISWFFSLLYSKSRVTGHDLTAGAKANGSKFTNIHFQIKITERALMWSLKEKKSKFPCWLNLSEKESGRVFFFLTKQQLETQISFDYIWNRRANHIWASLLHHTWPTRFHHTESTTPAEWRHQKLWIEPFGLTRESECKARSRGRGWKINRCNETKISLSKPLFAFTSHKYKYHDWYNIRTIPLQIFNHSWM